MSNCERYVMHERDRSRRVVKRMGSYKREADGGTSDRDRSYRADVERYRERKHSLEPGDIRGGRRGTAADGRDSKRKRDDDYHRHDDGAYVRTDSVREREKERESEQKTRERDRYKRSRSRERATRDEQRDWRRREETERKENLAREESQERQEIKVPPNPTPLHIFHVSR
jgi:hypothetical protein